MADSSSVIAEAIQKARYNETVTVTIENDGDNDNDKSVQEICLVPCLDETNGGIQWNPLIGLPDGQPEAPLSQTLILSQIPAHIQARHLRTKRWMFPMLNDHRRNQLYEQAIQASTGHLVDQLLLKQKHETQPDTTVNPLHVLDIGSGTGLLAMMAARALRNHLNDHKLLDHQRYNVQVTSIEMANPMADLARQTVARNQNQSNQSNNQSLQTQSNINVQQGHSCSLPALTPRADYCVSELLESGLLAEGLLPALRDAWERHMHPNDTTSSAMSIMIPQRARVYAQLVQGAWLTNYYGPHNNSTSNSNNNSNADDDDKEKSDSPTTTTPLQVPVPVPLSFRLSTDPPQEEAPASSLLLDARAVRLEVHADQLLQDASLLPLSDPVLILNLGLSRDQIPDAAGGRKTTILSATANGRAHGVLVWWELDLWDDICYSTQPGKEPWQDHWHQCLHILPADSQLDLDLVVNESVTLRATHDDSRISVDVFKTNREQQQQQQQQQKGQEDESAAQRPRYDATSSALISPERAYQLNDSKRTALLQKAINNALDVKGKDAVLLDLSDFSLCAGLAAVAGATNVYSVESSSGALPMTAAIVAQIGNNLPRENARFDILQCHAEQLSLDLLGGAPAAIVVAEPYYEILEGWNLQEALNYYYLVRALRMRGVVSPTACVVPSSCRLMGCAIESEQLRLAYRACGDATSKKDGNANEDEDEHTVDQRERTGSIRGFDHSVVNAHGDCFHKFDLSLSLWQYPYKRLSPQFEIANLSFSDPLETPSIESISRGSMDRTGTCDAIMVWLEYDLGLGSDASTLSTDGRSYRQIVRMMKTPVPIEPHEIGKAALVCKCILGGLDGAEDHQFEIRVDK